MNNKSVGQPLSRATTSGRERSPGDKLGLPADEPTTMQLRNTLRQTFRERRRRLSNDEQRRASQQLLDICLSKGLLSKAKKVALYMTNDGELSTRALIEHCWQAGIQVYVPVLHPFSDGHLLFIEYTRCSPMRANGFGIAEPNLDCTKVCPITQLDVLFSPLVAFDDYGNRLGMGGGFYDRTLAQFAGTKPMVVGIAHDIQKTLSLPTEVWDIPLPWIVTPSKLYDFTKA